MIEKQTISPRTQVAAELEPVALTTRIARKMIELQFSGITVTAEALAAKGFTLQEINENWEKARDEATIMERENNRAA